MVSYHIDFFLTIMLWEKTYVMYQKKTGDEIISCLHLIILGFHLEIRLRMFAHGAKLRRFLSDHDMAAV